MSLFIGRIAPKTTEKEIEELFSKHGTVTKCYIKGAHTPFCFLTFKDERDAEDAIRDLNDYELHGARINVEWAKDSGRSSNTQRSMRESNCFECGETGHFARDCRKRAEKNRRRSPRRSRSRSPRRRSRSRSRGRDRDRESSRKDRSRSRDRKDRDRGRDRSRSRDKDKDRDRDRSDKRDDKDKDKRDRSRSRDRERDKKDRSSSRDRKRSRSREKRNGSD